MGMKMKTEKRHLMCRLSEHELEEQGKALTDLLQEKAELEISKSASARHYSDAIKAVDVKIEKQIPIVRDREIEREVECRIEYHLPEMGKKRITRLDTMEVIFEGQMTDSECQDLFINAEHTEEDSAEDEAIDVPAVKLLPAPADEVPIHLEKPEPGKDNEIKLEAGKRYEINGKVYRCEDQSEGRTQCQGCIYDETDDEDCIDYALTCMGVILKAEDAPAVEAPAAPEDKPAEEETTEVRRPVVCEKCGHPGHLYHVNQGTLMCDRCIDIKNEKNLNNIEEAIREKKTILVRPSFGYGCISEDADTTCFRFLIGKKDNGKGSSWGTPIYIPGDYRKEGSEAADYYKQLIEDGVKEG